MSKFTSSEQNEPNQFNQIPNEMNQFKSQKIMAAFAHGVWMTYAALQSQEEADQMNSDWGV